MTDFDVQPGDIYSLGNSHRLMCGDATKKEDVKRLFDGRKPTLVVTSPPYAKQRDYDRPIACWDSMMLGALDGHDFADDVQLLINLGIIYAECQYQEYWSTLFSSLRGCGWRIYANYIWHKTSVIPGEFGNRLTPAHEFVFHINKTKPHVNAWEKCSKQPWPTTRNVRTKNGTRVTTKRLPRSHKKPTSVLSLCPARSAGANRHPAVFPVELPQRLIRSFKVPDALAYDPFVGSGTTLHAAKLEGVTGLGMEISPAYTSIALARWAKAYPEQKITKIN